MEELLARRASAGVSRMGLAISMERMQWLEVLSPVRTVELQQFEGEVIVTLGDRRSEWSAKAGIYDNLAGAKDNHDYWRKSLAIYDVCPLAAHPPLRPAMVRLPRVALAQVDEGTFK